MLDKEPKLPSSEKVDKYREMIVQAYGQGRSPRDADCTWGDAMRFLKRGMPGMIVLCLCIGFLMIVGCSQEQTPIDPSPTASTVSLAPTPFEVIFGVNAGDSFTHQRLDVTLTYRGLDSTGRATLDIRVDGSMDFVTSMDVAHFLSTIVHNSDWRHISEFRKPQRD
jgi:hypothetical protein